MIKFYNIRSGETRVAEGEPHIAALWACSDRSPNITQGQDFGWRLAPETVVEMQNIMRSPRQMESIAVQAGIIPDNITESDVLAWIANKEDKKAQGMETSNEDFKSKYEAEIARLQATGQADSKEAIIPEEKKVETETPQVQVSAPAPQEPVNEPETPTEEPEEVTSEGEPSEPEQVVEPTDSGDEDSTEEVDTLNPAMELAVDDSMTRAKLETVAKDLKIDAPSGYKNKTELVEAIQLKQGSTS